MTKCTDDEKLKPMQGNVYESINRFYEGNIRLVCLLAAGIVLFLDFITGVYIRFPVVYILPVGMAAWKKDEIFSYILAIMLPLVRGGGSFHLAGPTGTYFGNNKCPGEYPGPLLLCLSSWPDCIAEKCP